MSVGMGVDRIVLMLALVFFAPCFLMAELPPPRPESTPVTSTVYFALDQQAVGPGMTPRLPLVLRMVEGLVCAVTGKPNPKAAWLSLVKPGEKIGIKVSAQPGPIGLWPRAPA